MTDTRPPIQDTSVRPPDSDGGVAAAATADDRDPLAGWDAPGASLDVSSPPPPAWSVMAGMAGFAGLAGLATGLGHGTALRRGVGWSALGAAAAAVALRVWELEPESARWAATVAKGSNSRP